MHLVMINNIDSFFKSNCEMSNLEVLTLLLTGILFGIVLADLLAAIAKRKANKKEEAR